MMKILHIIDKLSSAGPTRSLIAAAKYASQQGINEQHCVITLQENVYPLSLIQAKQCGIKVFRKPDQQTVIEEIKKADIVQIHFWNNPEVYEFIRLDLPPMRLLTMFHIIGDHPPQVITQALLNYSDFSLVTSPYTLTLPVFKNSSCQKTGVVYGIADWDRLVNLQPQPHQTFNVGYIGTVNFAKMNPNYIPMSASIEIPNIKFIVCGGGIQQELQQQAQELGASDKFDFLGYVENIKSVLEILDVFGYPLCEDTYATSEKSLQEAMYAGIPPVVFPYAGVKCLVEHNQTGLIVESDLEYKQAIEYLYYNPQERLRLGKNARNYALKYFNSQDWSKKLHGFYQEIMKFPKRQHSWQNCVNFADHPTPAQMFIQSLGKSAPQFQESMSGMDLQDLLVAESKIAASSVLLASGEGGIIQYRNHYPNDPYLRLWSGLIFQYQGRHSLALKEFTAAIDLGCDRPCTHWHIAQSALAVKDFHTAETALNQVIKDVPNFQQAKDLLKSLEIQ